MRVTIPRVLAFGLSVLLAGYVFVIAPRMHSAAAQHPAQPAAAGPKTSGQPSAAHPATSAPVIPARNSTEPVFPPAGKKFIGIMTSSGPYSYTDLDNFTKAAGYQPSVYEFAQGWAVNQFNKAVIDSVARRGMLPLISWEPWDYRKESPIASERGNQPAYSLSYIISGRYDSYIRSWAEGVKGLGYTIGLRFAHEMNGNWYPWAVFDNGNTPAEYVQAWRHVHDIFTQVGATNVIWVWSPNIIWNSFTDLKELYPGDSYVDWIGLSGYYGTPGKLAFQSFDQIFTPTINELRTFTSKPLVITETGATPVGGEMSDWITQMFQELPSAKDVIGVIWFEAFNVVDWKITDDTAAGPAFKTGYANPEYRIRWSPGMRPQLTLPSASVTPSASP